MIKTITITNFLGESLVLDMLKPALSGFAIKEITGLGPVNANINTTEIASADGALYNSGRLSSRNIVFHLIYQPGMHANCEELRLKTYKYFPIKKEVSLRFQTDTRDAEIIGYVESNEPDIFSNLESCTISIICPDPYFYSINGNGDDTVFSGFVSEFEFPFENNSTSLKLIEMGLIESLTEQTVLYTGDADIGVTIIIHAIGKAGSISIYNIRTREMMTIDNDKIASITGSGISSGDTITICTEKGRKSIVIQRDGVITNILNALDRGSNWFQITKGDNIFTYTATTGASNLQFRIVSRVIYEGV